MRLFTVDVSRITAAKRHYDIAVPFSVELRTTGGLFHSFATIHSLDDRRQTEHDFEDKIGTKESVMIAEPN